MNAIEFNEKIDRVVEKYNLIDNATYLKQEYGVMDTNELQKSLESIDDENRVLKVGVVGRVKAGKSSLLNALVFDGENVLPKAATPMTASLVMMQYADEISADVEFFTQNDLEDIEKEYDRYNKQLQESAAQKLKDLKEKNKKNRTDTELEERALKQAKRELKNDEKLFSSYDQYSRIKDSTISLEELQKFKEIKADSTKELNEKLIEFVGADGKYMPFTKSVTLKLKEENLKDLQIIDTPGVNDPVASREERTRELLKYCDVVFIVSPSGQFLSSEDIDLLDRIRTKEGINEIYIIASQVDNQLHGSEKEMGDGVFSKVLDHISQNLTNHMRSVFENDEDLKGNKTFEELLKNRVIHSSGICYSLMNKLNDKNQFDTTEGHIWKLLQTNYKDFFNDDAIAYENLKSLANIDKIKDILKDVKSKKELILKSKKDDFLQAKQTGLVKYKEALIKDIEIKITKLQESNIEDVQKKKEQLQKIVTSASVSVTNKYKDLINDLEIDIQESLLDKLNTIFRRVRGDISDAEGEGSETEKIDRGFLQGLFSLVGGKDRYETKTRYYTTVRAGFVRNSLEDLSEQIEKSIEIDAKKYLNEWKKILLRNLISILRDKVGDENLELDMISNTIKKVLHTIKYPEIVYNTSLPAELKKSGTLTGSSAERFIEETRDYLDELKDTIKSDIKRYINTLISSLEETDIGEDIFKKYKNDIEELENSIKNIELVIEKNERILKELNI